MSCRWFRFDRTVSSQPVKTLEGPWGSGLEAAHTNLQLSTRLRPAAAGADAAAAPATEDVLPDDEASRHVETLLSSHDQIIAGRVSSEFWNGGQVIVIANGSWLLNLPLVNHEHRKLAGRLTDACGPPGRVCFLESGRGGPRISESDTQLPLMLRAFTVWPVNAILLHLTLLGILFCFCVYPIFGRARSLPPDSTSDFGKHVSAVGDLLEQGGNAADAQQRLQQYQDMMQRNNFAGVPNRYRGQR